jgi:hypothetical protein
LHRQSLKTCLLSHPGTACRLRNPSPRDTHNPACRANP